MLRKEAAGFAVYNRYTDRTESGGNRTRDHNRGRSERGI